MGLLTDILKEIPQAAVLKEKIADIEAKYAASDTENAILKDDLREAKIVIEELKQQVKELTHQDDLDDIEIKILKNLTEIDVANAVPDIMYQWLDMSKARCQYHFQRIETAGYAHIVYGDDLGPHYAVSPKGLELLFKRDLI